MKALEEKIDVMDYTFKTWFKKHVKWVKEVVCYINADDCYDEDTFEVYKHVFVIVVTYSKANPFEIHSTLWKKDKIILCQKATISDINRSLCLSNIIIPYEKKKRFMQIIFGLLISKSF